jgi:hypothetical protein
MRAANDACCANQGHETPKRERFANTDSPARCIAEEEVLIQLLLERQQPAAHHGDHLWRQVVAQQLVGPAAAQRTFSSSAVSGVLKTGAGLAPRHCACPGCTQAHIHTQQQQLTS